MKEPDEGAPFPGARPHLRISPDLWDDRSWMNTLVRATFDNLPPSKQPKPRTAAKTSAATKSKTAKRKSAGG
jgi:hypothetical protein